MDLIKVDVEGGELDVLRGAADVLTHQRPTLYLDDNQFISFGSMLPQRTCSDS